MRARLALVAIAAVLVLGHFYGYVRGAVAVLMFGAIVLVGGRLLSNASELQDEPEVADVGDYGLRYVCRMCGLELKVEKAARDKPPTHCMEPMMLVREGGKPPLRPV